MKKRLLICSALALAGCSSSPGTGDVEKFLEPKFASCQNIEVVDIKKTNGYEEDGYYRVEYTFRVKLKKPSQLKALLEQWQQEKAEAVQIKEEQAQFYDAEEALNQEIWALKREFATQYPPIRIQDFSPSTRPFHNDMSKEAREAYTKAQHARDAQEDAFTKPKRDELDALKKAWTARLSTKTFDSPLLGNERDASLIFYYKGCPRDAVRMSEVMFTSAARASNQTNDPSHWFQEINGSLEGTVTMRKTDKGWRALSEG